MLNKHNLEACVVSHVDSVTYLTGFKGLVPTERESYALVTLEQVFLIIPRMYQVGAEKSLLSGVKLIVCDERNTMLESFKQLIGTRSRVGCEAESLTIGEFDKISDIIGVKPVAINGVLSKLRLYKSEAEVEKIKAAQELTYKALDDVLPYMKVGVSEYEIQMKLNSIMVGLGAEGPSFEAIIAFGKASAEPHYKTSGQILKKGDMILIDCGALLDGYCGDTTRVFFTQKPNSVQKETYDLVRQAQEKAIEEIKAGMTAEDGWKLSYDVFVQAGVESAFLHGLGHGIGVAVHEAPSLRKGVMDKLEEGMVLSVEPGLYYSTWGGVRIEDLVVCRKNGVDVLGTYPKDIRVLSID